MRSQLTELYVKLRAPYLLSNRRSRARAPDHPPEHRGMVGIGYAPVTPSLTGFSFSPGGLLFPYHLGVVTALNYHKRITDKVHLAGASAGAIAVACFASQTPSSEQALEGAIRICEICDERFGGNARGNLFPLLKNEMECRLSQDAHEIVNSREGTVALAHRELFPRNGPVLTTEFETREDLIEAVCDSSTFPFFFTNFPARVRRKRDDSFPSVIVDGFFNVPRERFGCPDFDQLSLGEGSASKAPMIERTITVACLPHDTIGLTCSEDHNKISPAVDMDDKAGQLTRLLKYATQPSPRKELEALYEQGWQDAEIWHRKEEARERKFLDRLRNDGSLELN